MTKFFLAAVIFLAAFLRLFALSENPPSLNWDEVSHGYNAYSILKTGKDEWGQSFPLTSFRAFGDYKLPVYIYVTVPFVAIFGLDEWVVRLPSALSGALAVLGTFLLVKKLFKNDQVAILASLTLAISPWNILLSRGAFEGNVAATLVIFAVYFFLLGLEKSQFLILASLFFGLSLFTYNSARVFVPLFLVFLVVIFCKELAKLGRKLIIPAGLFLVFTIILLTTVFKPESQARFYWTTILDQGAINNIDQARTSSQLPGILNIAINNKPTYFISHFIPNYLSHFSPRFLFFEGGSNFQYSIPQSGVLYSIEAVLIIFGLWFLIRKRTKFSGLIFAWLLLGPIAAAATRESPNVLRAILVLPTWQVISGLGFFEIKKLIGKFNINLGFFFTALILIILGFSTFRFLGNYFGDYRTNYSFAWQYGYKEVAQFLSDHRTEYDRIVISKKYGEPHEFLLYNLQIDPKFYLNDPNLVRCPRSNWFWVDKFNGFEFVNDWEVKNLKKDEILPAACPQEIKKFEVEKMLLVTSPQNFPEGGKLIKTIDFLNGEPAFDLVEY